MKPIVTVTVNPCIDINSTVDVLMPEKKLQCHSLKKEPGGGGINISRVINRLGGDTAAIYLEGGYTGKYFTKLLSFEGVHTHIIPIANHTRENFIVEEISTNKQFRFGLPGPYVLESEWKQCLDSIAALHNAGYIVASGSLSPGVPVDFFARIAFIAKQKKIKFILDSSGEALKAALEEGLYMIKPNLGELSSIAGIKELDKGSANDLARSIILKGQCEMILVSMGSSGAILVTDTLTEHTIAPAVKVKSTVGAGDSMLAGMIFGLSSGKPLKESLQFAVACGTAATMEEGTALCDLRNVELLMQLISAAKV